MLKHPPVLAASVHQPAHLLLLAQMELVQGHIVAVQAKMGLVPRAQVGVMCLESKVALVQISESRVRALCIADVHLSLQA